MSTRGNRSPNESKSGRVVYGALWILVASSVAFVVAMTGRGGSNTSRARAPADRTLPRSVALRDPHEDGRLGGPLYLAPVPPLARARTRPTGVGDPGRAGDPQRRAFLDHRDAMLELRTNASWWMWDLFDASLEACRPLVSRTALCWFRFRATVANSAATLRAQATSSCSDTDFANAHPGDPQTVPDSVRTCIDSRIADIEQVPLPAWAGEELDGYDGPLDLEVLISPGDASQSTRVPSSPDGGRAP